MTNGAHIPEEELQLLALGALPEAEAAAALEHARGCVECGAKLAQERGRAAMLAFAIAQEKPAATIKAELFARIRAEEHEQERAAWPGKTAAHEAPRGTGEWKRGWWLWVLAPATALLLVATVLEWRENQRLAAELGNANRQVVEMVGERQRTEMLMNVLTAPDTLSVKMSGTPETAKATGMVRYNPGRGLVLYTAVLPPLPADKIYQMWLVPKTGAPISAGVFAPGTHGSREMWTAAVPLNTEVKAFAVTIEPAGGVVQPTGARVLLGAG